MCRLQRAVMPVLAKVTIAVVLSCVCSFQPLIGVASITSLLDLGHPGLRQEIDKLKQAGFAGCPNASALSFLNDKQESAHSAVVARMNELKAGVGTTSISALMAHDEQINDFRARTTGVAIVFEDELYKCVSDHAIDARTFNAAVATFADELQYDHYVYKPAPDLTESVTLLRRRVFAIRADQRLDDSHRSILRAGLSGACDSNTRAVVGVELTDFCSL